MDGYRLCRFRREKAVERGVNCQPILFKKIGKVHREGTERGGRMRNFKIRSRFRVQTARAPIFRRPSSVEFQHALRLLPVVSGTREKEPRLLQRAAWHRQETVEGSPGGELLLPDARGNAQNRAS